MTPAHQAVETGDLKLLLQLVRAGADINEEFNGLTLLHHAVEVELDSHHQSGKPLHVDMTALLLALGADPLRRSSNGTGITADHFAFTNGHWLATSLFEWWTSITVTFRDV